MYTYTVINIYMYIEEDYRKLSLQQGQITEWAQWHKRFNAASMGEINFNVAFKMAH